VDDLNQIIQQAIGNTGGGEMPPSTAPLDPPAPGNDLGYATPEGGRVPSGQMAPEPPAPPASPDEFPENFDYNTLPEDQRQAYRHWHAAYTKARQKDAERLRELEARGSEYVGLDPEAARIASDYQARLAQGDFAGASRILSEQQQALAMMQGGYGPGYGPGFAPGYGPGGPSPYAQPGAQPYQDAYQGSYDQGEYQAPDPIAAQLQAIQAQNRMWQISQELSAFQHRLGRNLTPMEQSRMMALKNQAPALSFEQVYQLTHRAEMEREIVERVTKDIAKRLSAGGGQPPPPAGAPPRAPIGNQAEPVERADIIAQAVAQATRNGY